MLPAESAFSNVVAHFQRWMRNFTMLEIVVAIQEILLELNWFESAERQQQFYH